MHYEKLTIDNWNTIITIDNDAEYVYRIKRDDIKAYLSIKPCNYIYTGTIKNKNTDIEILFTENEICLKELDILTLDTVINFYLKIYNTIDYSKRTKLIKSLLTQINVDVYLLNNIRISENIGAYNVIFSSDNSKLLVHY